MKVVKKKPSYTYDPTKDGVTQSILATYFACREACRRSVVLGQTYTGVRTGLIFGDLSHGILELCYRQLINGVTDIRKVVNSLPTYADTVGTKWMQNNPFSTTAAKDVVEESLAILLRVMPAYFTYWWDRDTSVEWVGAEEEFSVPVTFEYNGEVITVPVRGKRDGEFIKRTKRRERLWLFETKNFSQISSRLEDTLPIDTQVGTYITRLEAQKATTVAGVEYNIIRRPGLRRKVNESLREYCDRIEEDVTKRPDHYFSRYPIELTVEEKKFHAASIMHKVREFYAWWRESSHAEMDLGYNCASCDGKYGACQYLDACVSGDETGLTVRTCVHPELSTPPTTRRKQKR